MKNIFSFLLFLIICWVVRPISYCEMHTDQFYRPQIVKESKQNINISQDELKFLEDNDQETILCQNLPGADGFTFRTPGKPRIRRTGDVPIVDLKPGQPIYGIGNYPKVPNPRIAATQKNDANYQCPKVKQNKAGIDELPDSSKFVYSLETKVAKKQIRKVWKNPKARK